MPVSVRLDAKTTDLVDRLARRRGLTKSEVLRVALRQFAEREAGEQAAGTAYDRLAHLIGCFDSGGANLSERTGERFAAALRGKKRARRSR